MFDFSDDEWVFMFVALAGACIGIWRWYWTLLAVSLLNAHWKSQVLLAVAPVASLVLLAIVLQNLADPVYVAGHLDYQLLFLAGGACWIFGAAEIFSLMGVSTW